MDIQVLADIGLFLSAFTASIYCLRLQRRLRLLQDQRGDVQQAIRQLSDGVVASQAAASALRNDIATAVQELDQRFSHLRVKRQEIDDVLDAMDGQIGLQLRRCHDARQLTERALTPLVRKAELEIQALTRALEMKADHDRAVSISEASGHRAERDWDELLSRVVDGETVARRATRRQEPGPDDMNDPLNPFLRAVGE